jgi:penicillin-binding protein 1A
LEPFDHVLEFLARAGRVVAWPFLALWHGMGRFRHVVAWTVGGLAVFAVAGILFVSFLPQILGLFAPKLDTTADLYAANRPIAITFVDAKGDVVGHRGAIVGERLTLKQMPGYLPAAFIAMEDRSFWSNSGIDVKGLLRATYLNMRARHVVAGGSTITQQAAKIVFTNEERTFDRKLDELWDAAELNKSLSKTQILELYLNRIYLGSGAYGVDGAAHVYFGKSAQNLTLAQAAMLATLTRAPSAFSPRRDLAAAQARTKTVLRAMVETGAITQDEADNAAAHPAAIIDRSVIDARNYYFDTAADEAKTLIAAAGKAADTDIVVHTTFEPRLEDAARKAINTVLKKQGKKRHAHEAAAVIMKPDGAVAALIGGRDYDDSVFNRATQAMRQPGSSFKPFVYLAALEQGISPWDTRTDEPVDINGWSPTNFGGEQYGTITVADALAHSVNTITAELAQEVGVTTVVNAAKRCGITTPIEAVPSIALGTSLVTPYEMTAAYAVFANGGMKVEPYLVTEVEDARGHILYNRKAPQPQRIIASHVDRDLTAMLYGVTTEGTGRSAAVAGHETAGKTGTTQDYHDAWFIGFTTDYVASVWVGNDDSSPMKIVTGGSLPAEIWNKMMTVAEKGMPAKPLDKSEPQLPTDENGVVITAGSGDNGEYHDDEAPAPPTQQQQPGGERKNFWDWLFGRGDASRQQQDDETSQRDQRQYDEQDGNGAQYGPPPDAPPRQVPRYRWRSEQGPPPQQPDATDPNAPPPRQYGVDPNDPGDGQDQN